jgi:hypothetical protein
MWTVDFWVVTPYSLAHGYCPHDYIHNFISQQTTIHNAREVSDTKDEVMWKKTGMSFKC